MNKEILDMDATSIANAIKNKELTSFEVTNTYIQHIQAINPALNALVEERYQIALKEALEKDREQSSSPLHGVPISVKESFDVKGLKTTGGLIQRKDLMAKKDSEVVQRLKNAGAIVLGKTNTPALCFAQETDNKLFGRTNNPWDLSRTAGGSSGGEGALLAVGGAAVGIGSDIGGSIRFPSHFNGVVGFKPGQSRVSDKGHFPPIHHDLQQRMLGCGPMGKSVRDMELLHKLLYQGKEELSEKTDLKVEVLPADNGYPLSTETKQILEDIEKTLQTTRQVTRTIPPYFTESSQIWQEIMSIDGANSMKEIAFSTDRAKLWKELIKENMTKQSQVHNYLTWALIGANLFKPSKQRIQEIRSFLVKGDQQLTNYLQDRLLVFPVYHSSSQKHGKVYKEIFSIQKTFLKYMPYVAYANVWGLPSLVVPVAEDKDGMPISVQIMSKPGNEKAIFELGQWLEANFRGYIRNNQWDN